MIPWFKPNSVVLRNRTCSLDPEINNSVTISKEHIFRLKEFITAVADRIRYPLFELSGGDPFQYTNLSDIILVAKSHGMSTIMHTTFDGSRAKRPDKKLLQKLKHQGMGLMIFEWNRESINLMNETNVASLLKVCNNTDIGCRFIYRISGDEVFDRNSIKIIHKITMGHQVENIGIASSKEYRQYLQAISHSQLPAGVSCIHKTHLVLVTDGSVYPCMGGMEITSFNKGNWFDESPDELLAHLDGDEQLNELQHIGPVAFFGTSRISELYKSCTPMDACSICQIVLRGEETTL